MRRFWMKMNILYEKLMLFLFVMALLVVAYGLYDTWYVYHHASDDSYLRYKPTASEGVPEDAPITDGMVAWLAIDDTNIDYPVMQSDDNYRYLNENPYGEYSLSGSIFLDSRNDGSFGDPYSILYGHHMEYGKMFGALDDFLEPAYLNSHTHGELIVGRNGEKRYQLRVFAAVRVNVFEESDIFEPDVKDIRGIIRKHAITLRDMPEEGKKILALSTCTEPVSRNRLIVFCEIME